MEEPLASLALDEAAVWLVSELLVLFLSCEDEMFEASVKLLIKSPVCNLSYKL